MYCEKCGAKAKDGAKYCEECGSILKKQPDKRKPLSKKNKIIIGISGLFVILIIAFFAIGSALCKPKRLAVNYFEAALNNDYDALYQYFDVEDKNFTSKKVFKKLNKTKEDKDTKDKVVNYSVISETVSADKLSAVVIINYVTNDSKNDTVSIKLIKNKKNKMLFFNNWKISNSKLETIRDYQIKVIKGSKVEVAGIKLDKYISKSKSTDEFDVYVLPELFNLNYPVKVTYPFGVKIDTSLTPNSYSKSTTLEIDVNKISKEVKKEIEDITLKNIQTIYNASRENKTFDEVKTLISLEEGNLPDFQKSYDEFKEDINDRSYLTEITIKSVTLSDLAFSEEGNLEVSFSYNYDYKTTYEFFGETKTSENSGKYYSSMEYSYDKGYKLVDFDNLKYYFY